MLLKILLIVSIIVMCYLIYNRTNTCVKKLPKDEEVINKNMLIYKQKQKEEYHQLTPFVPLENFQNLLGDYDMFKQKRCDQKQKEINREIVELANEPLPLKTILGQENTLRYLANYDLTEKW